MTTPSRPRDDAVAALPCGDALDALLAGAAAPALADDGFSAGVMRRVQALQAARWLPPGDALALARRRRASGRRQALYSAVGAGLGALLAATALALAPTVTGTAAAAWAPVGVILVGGMATALALLWQTEV